MSVLVVAIVYATGLTEEDMNKAQVGISSVGAPIADLATMSWEWED